MRVPRHQALRRAAAVAVALLISATVATPTLATMGHAVAAPSAVSQAYTSGDTRCYYGPGIQVWQDANHSGKTMLLCGNHAEWGNLGGMVENLGAGCHLMCTTWNDIISSFQTFNMSHGVGVVWYLCWDGFSGSCLKYTSDVTVDTMGGWNDQLSSIKDH